MNHPAVIAWRPSVRLQQDAFECGPICVEVLHAMFRGGGTSVPPQASTDLASARGLTIRALSERCRLAGLSVRTLAFDPFQAESFPSPGVVLLSRGHYVVTGRRRGQRIDVFDPAVGWMERSVTRLASEVEAIAIEVTGVVRGEVPVRETPRRQGIGWRMIRESLTPFGRRVIVLSVMARLAMLVVPLLTAKAVDSAASGVATGTNLPIALFAFMFLTAIGALTGHAFSAAQSSLRGRISLLASDWTVRKFSSAGTEFLERHPVSSLHAALLAVTRIQEWYGSVASVCASVGVLALVGMAAMAFVSPWLIVPGLAGIAASIMVDLGIRRRLRDNETRTAQTHQAHAQFVSDILSQLSAFNRAGAERQARARLRRLTRSRNANDRANARLTSLRSSFSTFSGALENLVFVSLAGFFMANQNYSLGTFVAAGLFKDQLGMAIRMAFDTWKQYDLLLAQRQLVARLESIADVKPHSVPMVSAGRLSLREVRFRHSRDDPFVLDGVSLDIAGDEMVVISGASGAGKTTLARIVCGLSTPTDGTVLVDGQPIDGTCPAIAAVLQSDRLFTGSLKENVTLLRSDIPEDRVRKALQLAGLGEFVDALPMGLMTPVGEGLAGLSGGQRQRILLARALVGNPRVLILDESTSNLDLEAERKILSALRALGITVLLFSHRPETWRFAGRHFELLGGALCSREVPAPQKWAA